MALITSDLCPQLCAFCKFILFSMFEMRFFVMVWKAQSSTSTDVSRRTKEMMQSLSDATCMAPKR